MRRYRTLLVVLLLSIGATVAAPEGLEDQADALNLPVLEPIHVRVGLQIDQVTFVDQRAENFGVVANIRLEWKDMKLAFDAEEYGRDYRVFDPADFARHIRRIPTLGPGFVIQNQQDRRWEQQALVVVHADGSAQYLERSTVTLQAPHFNFRKFPFDTQRFLFELVSLYPIDTVRFVAKPEESGLGDTLGEEAWIMQSEGVFVDTVIGLSGSESARVVLEVSGRRHIQYYALRIFLPMLVLVVVSWATFFLDEYRRRIEIAGANLLAFVIFNFAVSDSLPQLGYLTFLDFILQWMFIVTAAIIVLNVGLSRLKKSGREDLAKTIDTYVIKWIYPIGYGAVVAFAISQYLLPISSA